MSGVLSGLRRYFGLWVLLVATLAFFWAPGGMKPFLPAIPSLLGVIMLGMGLSLEIEAFGSLWHNPRDLAIGVLAQFTVMPFLGWLLATWLHLPMELAVGLILVGCCPGGTASNLMTYLSRGDVALAVCLTGLTTLLAPVVTPALLAVLAKRWIAIQPLEMVISMLQVVLFPVVLGLVCRRVFPHVVQKVGQWMPVLSILAILMIIATVINVNATRLGQMNGWVLPAVVLHNGLGLLAGYGVGRWTGMSVSRRRALTFEVGMQDSGLGVALAVAHLGPLYALPSALFSVWQNLSGPLVTHHFARRPVDSEHLAEA